MVVRKNTQRIFLSSTFLISAAIESCFMRILTMLMMIWRIVTMTGPMTVGKMITRKIEAKPKVFSLLSLTEQGRSTFLLSTCSVITP